MRFYCHLHKPGVLAPEVREVRSGGATDDALTEAIREAMPAWPAFERLDVYDEDDQAVCRVAYADPVTVH